VRRLHGLARLQLDGNEFAQRLGDDPGRRVQVKKELGEAFGRDVRFISICP
jgi:hypothetical protein